MGRYRKNQIEEFSSEPVKKVVSLGYTVTGGKAKAKARFIPVAGSAKASSSTPPEPSASLPGSWDPDEADFELGNANAANEPSRSKGSTQVRSTLTW